MKITWLMAGICALGVPLFGFMLVSALTIEMVPELRLILVLGHGLLAIGSGFAAHGWAVIARDERRRGW